AGGGLMGGGGWKAGTFVGLVWELLRYIFFFHIYCLWACLSVPQSWNIKKDFFPLTRSARPRWLMLLFSFTITYHGNTTMGGGGCNSKLAYHHILLRRLKRHVVVFFVTCWGLLAFTLPRSPTSSIRFLHHIRNACHR